MKTPYASLRSAFSLVELLVVITIIAILISLLLPALQSAREAARQAQCQNNMKQLGLACLNYENQHWCFPPSSSFPSTNSNPGGNRVHYRNWVIALLPFLEQQPLYDSFDFSLPINDPANRAARGADLVAMKCPTDTGHRVKFSSTSSAEGDNWARGNYAANASLSHFYPVSNAESAVGKTGSLSMSRWHRGIMGDCLSMGVSEVYDGTTNTILLAEVRVGLGPQDRRGTWALDHPGGSTLYGHGMSDDNGPNNCHDTSDDLLDCTAAKDSGGGVDAFRAACMTCYNSGSYQAGPRSQHPGGIFVTLADGSVRFVSNYIEKGTGPNATTATPSMATQFLCWQRICCSQDGQIVDGKKF